MLCPFCGHRVTLTLRILHADAVYGDLNSVFRQDVDQSGSAADAIESLLTLFATQFGRQK